MPSVGFVRQSTAANKHQQGAISYIDRQCRQSHFQVTFDWLDSTHRAIPRRALAGGREAGKCYNAYNGYMRDEGNDPMNTTRSMVISMRLPSESGRRLKRMANRHGWTSSDTSARLVEEGLRRSEFAFIDFRDSAAGRQAYVQGSSLAVWEVMLLVGSYGGNLIAVARHLRWTEARVVAAVNYAEAYPSEIEEALAENRAADLSSLKRMAPQTFEFQAGKAAKRKRAATSSR